MTSSLFETIGGWVVTAVFGLIGWVIKLIRDEIKEIKVNVEQAHDRVDQVELHAARTYTTKEDVRVAEKNILDAIIRLENKLDKKADKP